MAALVSATKRGDPSPRICPALGLWVQTSPRTPRTHLDHDWDEEAQALFRRLNIDTVKCKDKYRNMDAVYMHPTTGAKLFIGNQTAARSESVLLSEKVYHIVNCQEPTAANFFEGDRRFKYRRFPIAQWWRKPGVETHDGVLEYFENGCHAWIENALEAGHNVMVHCLAGAHRAGTTGVSFMMRMGKFDVDTAIRLAKWQRPVVDPFGSLLDLLARLQAAYEFRGDKLTSAVVSSPPYMRRSPDDDLDITNTPNQATKFVR